MLYVVYLYNTMSLIFNFHFILVYIEKGKLQNIFTTNYLLF